MNWPITRHVEQRARRLNDVMERLDVDALELVRLRQGDAYCDARKLCIECTHAAACLSWLGSPPAPGESPAFCPNLPLLDRFRRR